MKKAVFKTLERFNDSDNGLLEVLALLGFLYFMASFIVRA